MLVRGWDVISFSLEMIQMVEEGNKEEAEKGERDNLFVGKQPAGVWSTRFTCQMLPAAKRALTLAFQCDARAGVRPSQGR